MPFSTAGQKNGEIIGYCTMKTLLVTPPSQCSSFWWRTKFQQPQTTKFSRLHYAQSLVLPEVQDWASTKKIKQTKTASLTASNIKRGPQTCFQQWPDHWTKHVCAKGQNFQGDYVLFYTYPIYNKLQPSSRNFLIIPHKYSISFQFSLQLLISWWSASPSHFSEWLHILQLSQIIDTFHYSQPLQHPHEPAFVTQHSSTTLCTNPKKTINSS